MPYEVEIKAHADASLKAAIDNLAGVKGLPVTKDDCYYALPGDEVPRFRIRVEDGHLLVTAKHNRMEGGLECNEELEFVHERLEDKATMEAMARMLGYEVFIHKHKTGWSWMLDDVHVELLDVRHLGWYLEMEVISPVQGFEENKGLYDKLRRVLHSLGLGDDAIESRSYQEMLAPWRGKEE